MKVLLLSWRKCCILVFKSTSISLNALKDSSLLEVSLRSRGKGGHVSGYFGAWGGPMSTVSAVAIIGRELLGVLLNCKED